MMWPESAEDLSRSEQEDLHRAVRRHVSPLHLPLPVNASLFALGFVVPWLKFADIAMHGLSFLVHRKRMESLPPAIAAFYRERQRATWRRRLAITLGVFAGMLCLLAIAAGLLLWAIISWLS
jgi:hypothetical protein